MEAEQGKEDKQDASQVIPLKPSDTCLLSSCLKGPQSAAHSRAGAAKGQVPRGAALGLQGLGGRRARGSGPQKQALHMGNGMERKPAEMQPARLEVLPGWR